MDFLSTELTFSLEKLKILFMAAPLCYFIQELLWNITVLTFLNTEQNHGSPQVRSGATTPLSWTTLMALPAWPPSAHCLWIPSCPMPHMAGGTYAQLIWVDACQQKKLSGMPTSCKVPRIPLQGLSLLFMIRPAGCNPSSNLYHAAWPSLIDLHTSKNVIQLVDHIPIPISQLYLLQDWAEGL